MKRSGCREKGVDSHEESYREERHADNGMSSGECLELLLCNCFPKHGNDIHPAKLRNK